MQTINFSTYPIFEADQVLTSKHLNDLAGYLEEQQRLTRNKLIGIGIVCGLDVRLSDDQSIVTISPGVGITSEGYLVPFHGRNYGESASYQFFRPFDFGEREVYSFFEKNNKVIDLFELHEQKVEGAEPFAEIEGSLGNYVVFLFLDCVDKKLKNCIENDCNEKGTERSFTIRPLLVKKDDARAIICREESLNVPKTEAEIDNHVNARFYLPFLEAPRFLLENKKLTHYNELFVKYDNLVTAYAPRLQQRLVEAYQLYRPLFRGIFGDANPFGLASNNLLAKYNAVKNKSPFAVQYFYDHLRDLTDTYNEFRETVFDLMCECCPAPNRFPKHLRLGGLRTDIPCEPSPYRTRFIHAPIHNYQGVLKEKVFSLFRKLTLLIQKFVVPQVENLNEPVKITPGRDAHQPLSERSIPYYYNILNNGDLLKNWNDDRRRKCRYNENLSYHSNRYAGSPVPMPHILRPLLFDHRQYDFLRIEGHLGMNYRTALSHILNIRNHNNLPFDLIALKLSANSSGTTIDFSDCHFRDLEIMCQAWRKELECMLGDVVKGLSKVNIVNTLKMQAFSGGGPRDPVNPGAFATMFRHEGGLLATHLAGSSKIGDNVINQIEVKDDTLGVVLNEAVMTATVGGGDYYLVAENKLMQNELIRQLSREEYELAFAAPILVATHAIAFAEKVQGTCADLDIEKLEAGMKNLTAAALDYQKKLADYKVTEASRIQVNSVQMLRLMSVLIGRCTLEQLKIIKAEIERRKDQLRKMTLFSEYTTKNPGIEHDGGVPKGGTFILVYHDISREDTVIHKGPFTLRGRVLDENGEPLIGATVLVQGKPQGTITDFNGNFSIVVDQLPVTLEATLVGFGKMEVEVLNPNQSVVISPGDDNVSELFPAPRRYEVIADFYLPYLCCSDCPPIDYVILPPQEKVGLELSPTSYCVPVDPNFPGALFSVTPADGVVTGPGVSGSTASGFIFKPTVELLNDADELELTGFKVDGDEVPLTVMLFRKPEAKFDHKVEPIETIADGLFANLILVNKSSENAVKYKWEIQRAFINGIMVDNHVIETDSRDEITVGIFVKRGEEFKVRLTAFSKNCENETEQIIDVPFQDREIKLVVIDPAGNVLEEPKINIRTDGAFTLLATPGKGTLEPEELVEKLEFKLAGASDEANKYVFGAKGKEGAFEFKYVLPEGISDTILITFFKPGGGTIRPGGGIVINPGDLVITPGGGGVNRPGRDLVFTGVLTNQPGTLTEMRNDNRFRDLLGPSSDAFRVTSNLMEDLNENLSDEAKAKELAEGKHNERFAEKLNVATGDTMKRLARADKPADQAFIGHLLRTQMEQLVGMVALQNEDLKARDPLSKLLTKVINQVKKLKESGVEVDKGKKMSKSLEKLSKDLEDKPKAREKVEQLIESVKGN